MGYYRFAAADVADDAFRAQAISWVIAGGILAAIMGPWLATGAQTWFGSDLYIGAMVAVMGLQFVTGLLLLGLQIPPMVSGAQSGSGRSLLTIIRQPNFIVATLGSTVSYGIMVFVMTATPLAMAAAFHNFDQTASVIQWHIFGMFGPSLFTGGLIRRFGVLTMVQTGAVLTLGCMGLNLVGTSFWHFAIALLLLGLGWNFMYVGSTALLTETYRPVEKGKVQATHDFVMFSFVALATYLSGRIFHRFDWSMLNQISWPLVLATLVAVLWLQQKRWRVQRQG